MISEDFVYLGVIIASIGGLSYLFYTVKGKVKPNKVTYLLWAIAPLVAFIAEVQQGVGVQSLLTFIVGFLPLLIFIASFFNKKSEWRITKFDLLCGGLSIIGIIFWLLTQVGNIAITFSILADGLAALPTLVKAYKYPETESGWTYLTNSFSSAITLLTITKWTYASYAFPVYLFIISFLIYVSASFKIGRHLR